MVCHNFEIFPYSLMLTLDFPSANAGWVFAQDEGKTLCCRKEKIVVA